MWLKISGNVKRAIPDEYRINRWNHRSVKLHAQSTSARIKTPLRMIRSARYLSRGTRGLWRVTCTKMFSPEVNIFFSVSGRPHFIYIIFCPAYWYPIRTGSDVCPSEISEQNREKYWLTTKKRRRKKEKRVKEQKEKEWSRICRGGCLEAALRLRQRYDLEEEKCTLTIYRCPPLVFRVSTFTAVVRIVDTDNRDIRI